MDNNFKAISQLRFWCQKVLPLVYDDSLSYYEVLCKIQFKINELIINNNSLPQVIIDLIKDMLDGEEFNQIVAELLRDLFINVKYPPVGIPSAKGDGITDDTLSLQGCIDYSKNNGGLAIYIPSGNYLTQSLTLYSNTSLIGQDRYTTKITQMGGATQPLLNGNIESITLSDLEFNGNGGNQINKVNVIDITVGSGLLTNLIIGNGNIGLNINVTNNVQIDNILFSPCLKHSTVLMGDGVVEMKNVICESISQIEGISYIKIDVNDSMLFGLHLLENAPLGINITGNYNSVSFTFQELTLQYDNSGTNNVIECYGKIKDSDYEHIKSKADYLTVEVNESYNEKAKNRTSTNETLTDNATTAVYNRNSETVNSDISIENIETSKIINSTDIILNSTNPLTYKTPDTINNNRFFKSIPFKDSTNTTYNVAVLNDYYTNIVNILDFGAVEGGVIDCTQSFLDAFEHLEKGGVVLVPNGMFLITSKITVPSNITISGTTECSVDNINGDISKNCTIVSNTDINMFEMSSGSTIKNLCFHHADIVSPYLGLTARKADIIIKPMAFTVKIQNIYFHNSWIGINTTNIHGSVEIDSCWGSIFKHGIMIIGSRDCDRITNCYFNVGYLASNTTESINIRSYNAEVFYLEDGTTNMLNNCYVFSYHIGLVSKGCINNMITNCGFDFCDICVDLRGSSMEVYDSCYFVPNGSGGDKTADVYGIYCTTDNNGAISINNSVFYQNGYQAIVMSGSGWNISNCKFIGLLNINSSMIFIKPSTMNMIISGNLFNTSGATALYSEALYSSTISNNIFDGGVDTEKIGVNLINWTGAFVGNVFKHYEEAISVAVATDSNTVANVV